MSSTLVTKWVLKLTQGAPYYEDSTIESTYRPFSAANLSRARRNYVLAVAKQIMSWLLNSPLELRPSSSFQLLSKLDWMIAADPWWARDILCAHPGLLEKNAGSLQSSAPVFKGIPEDPLGPAENSLSELVPGPVPELVDNLLSPISILNCFSVTVDLLDNVERRYTCSVCACCNPLQDVKSDRLRYLAYLELYALPAHAISDSLGAKDVSGLSKSEDIAAAVHIPYHLSYSTMVL